jgi:leucyl-tRNA synthetase
MIPYDHKKIEPKWQKEWEKKKVFAAIDSSEKKKWYSLIEFPYPSGDGLHVGHIRSNTAMDIVSRKRRREGFNVLYPIGWDAFGLPTENYAIKTGIQPAVVTKRNTDIFRRQLKSLGFSFDWSREINTTDPKYYKWTQWIFLQFLKAGLAYKKKMAINWCPKDLIGLANEEVVDGKCERCGTPVEKREKEQWMLAITKYADKLLEGLDATDYVMPKLIDKTNPHQPGKPLIKRSVAHAIVFDPKNKKYLIIRNKKFGWDTVIIGGIEKEETAVDTALREIREETGYIDVEFKRFLGGQTEAHYYTKHKGENRIAFAQGVYLELKSDKRVPIAAYEDKDNEILWIDEADFVPGKMVNSELPIWLERIKDPKAGWPKPLLDWPKFIKDSQRNWIGKSEGAEIDFNLVLTKKKTRFVLIHGFEGSAHTNFFPWLKAELEKRGNEVEAPELPNSNHPKEEEQVEYVLKNCHFDENTVVVGHSLGAVVAMKALTKLNKPVSSLVLVAVAVSPKFDTHYDSRPFSKDFTWDFDYAAIRRLTGGNITVLSDTREDFRMSYLRHLAENLSARLVEATSKDEHFCADQEPSILQALIPSIKVFTTRPDTLFGVTYVVLAPEHPLVRELLPSIKNRSEALVYITKTKKESDIQRTDATREKTGVELKGVKATNPANGEEVPIYIADYVLADYGTGAVMAVPAHDERDWDFAKKYGLPIKYVIAPYFLDETENSKPRKDVETINRVIGVGIVKYWSENKYLMLDWKNGWTGFITGGIEAGEKQAEGIKREIREETGYTKVRFVKNLGGPNTSDFYAPHKKLNQSVEGYGMYLELVDDTKVEVPQEEYAKHEVKWIPEDEVLAFIRKGSPMGDSRYSELFWDRLKTDNYVWTDEGKLINSAQFNSKDSSSIKKEITAFAGGQWISKYKLHDWVFSRQRYWGEPIPVVYCDRCGIVPIPEKDLPVKLPPVKNYKPTETGESPLAAISKWVNTKCPKCKGPAKRETDTMPNWAGSSWYYLRYTDPKNAAKFADMKKLKYWTPVDWYNGGMEHVTLHLLYSRFWHKFLFDQGLVPTSEPYTKRTAHGLVLAKGGEKMSKSRGNVINPDPIIEKVGADSLRLYEMFMGPFDQAIAWDENGIVGCRRFLERVWKLQEKVKAPTDIELSTARGLSERAEIVGAEGVRKQRPARGDVRFREASFAGLEKVAMSGEAGILPLIQKTIKKVSEDIENMRFNTAVSALMILLNEFEKEGTVVEENFEIFLQLLAPFAPHITEELWNILGHKKSIHIEPWPTFDPSLLIESSVKIAVQVNGKTRAEIEIATDAEEEAIKATALALESVKKWLNGKAPSRIIVVKGRLINIVCPSA